MQFGAKPLFENISAKFGESNRYGLIGANGCGKSTFMKILSGELEPSSGNVSTDPNERVAKLNQDQFAYEEYSVIDTVADLETEFAEMDGYSAESKAGELLLGVGIATEQHYGPMSEIAPGFKLRVLLAQVLFSDPDIMLLDEPTNNLDIYTIKWLEDVLNQRDCTMIIISHDRHFLNSVCTHMADIDYGELRIYPGNYDEYMFAATQARERLLSENAKKKSQIAELQQFVSRFSANASKAKQATSRAKRIDKIQLDEVKASSRQSPFIRFEQEKQLFRNALEMTSLSQGFEETLFSGLEGLVEVGERIAIIGENGVGKTTLLNTLAGRLAPKSGEFKWSENANIGYYAQDHADEFEKDMNLFEWMEQWQQEGDDEQVVRSFLGRMLFSQNDIKKSVKVISGGEQGRMLFGKIMMHKPNILLMDEPTNHMDMESIEALNLALEAYEGTLMFVSHDRQFVSSVATRIWEIKDGKIIDFRGNYSEYLASKEA